VHAIFVTSRTLKKTATMHVLLLIIIIFMHYLNKAVSL